MKAAASLNNSLSSLFSYNLVDRLTGLEGSPDSGYWEKQQLQSLFQTIM